jgi:hypothetical protein
MASVFSRFVSDRRANLIVTTAMTLPFIAMVAGFAVDFAGWQSQDSVLKSVADSAAVAAARDVVVGGAGAAKVQSVAKAFVDAHMSERSDWGPYTVVGRPIENGKAVEVTVRQERSAQFADMVGVDPGYASVTSVARIVGDVKICVLTLAPSVQSALEVTDSASMIAGGCSVYSNSNNPQGFHVNGRASVSAGNICSSGGVRLSSPDRVFPAPLTDCPPFADPLAMRAKPPLGACTSNAKVVLTSGSHTLNPGIYCQNIEISGTAQVRFMPGIYVLRSSKLITKEDAQITGRHVGFYFERNNSGFEFLERSIIDLGAPKDGPMASILLWKDKDSNGGHTFIIGTNHARMLIGTIYLPGGRLSVTSQMPVADNSPWTAVVADRLRVSAGSQIVLNTNYGATDVPVPKTFDDHRNLKIYLTE